MHWLFHDPRVSFLESHNIRNLKYLTCTQGLTDDWRDLAFHTVVMRQQNWECQTVVMCAMGNNKNKIYDPPPCTSSGTSLCA